MRSGCACLIMVTEACAAISLRPNFYRRVFAYRFRRSLHWLRQSVYLNRTRLLPKHYEKFVILVWSSHKLWISNKRRQIVFRFTTWDYRPSQWLRINTIIINFKRSRQWQLNVILPFFSFFLLRCQMMNAFKKDKLHTSHWTPIRWMVV